MIIKSQICKQKDLLCKEFVDMKEKLQVNKWFENFSIQNGITIPAGILHRKTWEFCYIALCFEKQEC